MSRPDASILLVDDREEQLEEMRAGLSRRLGNSVNVIPWRPQTDEGGPNAIEILSSKVDESTTLVVTDHDLSTTMRGLFGSTIVAWCQSRYIPVCNFSRQTPEALTSVPGLFEFRLSPHVELTIAEAVRIYEGFRDLRGLLQEQAHLGAATSPAQALAALLGNPTAEFEFSPYFALASNSNGALFSGLSDRSRRVDVPVQQIAYYLIGHVLGNSILEYPGPILDVRSLGAFFGTRPVDEEEDLLELLSPAAYRGPFSGGRQYFWRERIDALLDELETDPDAHAEAASDVRARAILQTALGRELERHDCERCDGERGGFWCPFTDRPVCERADCSVSSSSWIPDGAWVTRVERDFYDEWGPILGY